MSYAHLLPATVILGGAGTLAVLASPEAGSRAPLYLTGGLALWALLAALWFLNFRAQRYEHWARQRGQTVAPPMPSGAFMKGAGVGLLLVIALFWLPTFLAPSSPALQQLAGWSSFAASGWGVALIPLIMGWFWSKVAATRIPRSL